MSPTITPILPTKQQFANVHAPHELNLEAICVFIATGFFLEDDTYWKDKVCLKPGHKHTFDNNGFLLESTPWFEWHYTPQNISFESTLENYISLLTGVIKEQVGNQQVILPLSGGLDSRSQAMVLKDLDNQVQAFSYSFDRGYPEHKISAKIAQVCDFKFNSFLISSGYLWDSIDELSSINNCYSEFTHPRQMAVLNELRDMEGIFSLGHWGDVFFDRGAPEGVMENEIVDLLLKKMVKKYGFELANKLWKYWNLEGDFQDYLIGRIETILSQFNIDNVSAKVRAFKTTQWAHRWTTTNLSIFEAAHPISLPFYDDRMCEFVCNTNEEFLADRKLQISHLLLNKELSKITWHAQRPFNLINYRNNRIPYNLPFRVLNKLKRTYKSITNRSYVQRNWELQFEGKSNDLKLKEQIFDNDFNEFIPKGMIQEVYNNFLNKDSINYAHPLSMLLTLSQWKKKYYKA